MNRELFETPMSAHALILVYMFLWMGWSWLVGLCLRRYRRRIASLGPAESAVILPPAVVPVLVLAFAAHSTRWIPARVNEMLSLMTPALLLLFAVEQLRRLRTHGCEVAADEARQPAFLRGRTIGHARATPRASQR
jgi:hypothetical protein